MGRAPRSGCPINAAVEVLGDPWATLVRRDVMFGNRGHFREPIAAPNCSATAAPSSSRR